MNSTSLINLLNLSGDAKKGEKENSLIQIRTQISQVIFCKGITSNSPEKYQ